MVAIKLCLFVAMPIISFLLLTYSLNYRVTACLVGPRLLLKFALALASMVKAHFYGVKILPNTAP